MWKWTATLCVIFSTARAVPVRFVEEVLENGEVRFHARVNGAWVLFDNDGATFVFAPPGADDSGFRPIELWNWRFIGASAEPQILWPLDETVRYYTEDAHERAARVAAAIVYKNFYPGVDLRFFGMDEGLKFDLVVAPGGNFADIRWTLEGPGECRIAPDRIACVPNTPQATLRFLKPTAWADGLAKPVEYRRFDDGSVGFCVDEVPDQTWIIDPVVLLGAGFYGGSDYDEIHAVGADSLGNAYAVGTTFSVNFPRHLAWQNFLNNRPNLPDNSDAFVLCWDLQTGRRKWATYFGGSRDDLGRTLAVMPHGGVILAGVSYSENMPLAGAYQGMYGGLGDGFAAVFDAQGRLKRSTYLGGNGPDEIVSAAPMPDGTTVLVGSTLSDDLYAFGGFSDRPLGLGDALVAVVDSNLSPRKLFYFGGNDQDYGKAVAADDSGRIWLAGETLSDFFPRFGDRDVFLAVFDGGELVGVSGVGSSDRDECAAVAVAPHAKAYVFGHTFGRDFPVFGTDGSYIGKSDWTLCAFAKHGTNLRLLTAGVFGGDDFDFARHMAVGGDGATLALVGETYSRSLDSDYQPNYGGGDTDGALMVADSTGRIRFFSYYGGSLNDELKTAAFATSRLIVAGKTESPDLYRNDYFQQTNLSNNSYDGCVAIFDATTLTHRTRKMHAANLSLLNIYPNPVYGDKFFIAGKSIGSRAQTFILYDETGREMVRRQTNLAAGDWEIEFRIPQNLPGGYYRLEGKRLLIIR
ncbi:MAG: hypothetical protein NZ534_00145 [Bacteroidia bacterium]|nr:hypothetical protein [Bacteroidia bacterium]